MFIKFGKASIVVMSVSRSEKYKWHEHDKTDFISTPLGVVTAFLKDCHAASILPQTTLMVDVSTIGAPLSISLCFFKIMHIFNNIQRPVF